MDLQAPRDLIELLVDKCLIHQKSHLSSAFSVLPTIHRIYSQIKSNDRVVLSNGHAAAALFVALEYFYKVDSDKLFSEMGDHPKRDVESGIWCSTGSLGMGLSVSVGMALSLPESNIYCIISDGECAEGVVWESLSFAYKQNLNNLKIYVVANGWSAYDNIDLVYLELRLRSFFPNVTIVNSDTSYLGLPGLKAHYVKMDEDIANRIRKALEK